MCGGRGAGPGGAPRAATSLRSPGAPRFPAGAPFAAPYPRGVPATCAAHLLATPRFFTRSPLIKHRNYGPAINVNNLFECTLTFKVATFCILAC